MRALPHNPTQSGTPCPVLTNFVPNFCGTPRQRSRWLPLCFHWTSLNRPPIWKKTTIFIWKKKKEAADYILGLGSPRWEATKKMVLFSLSSPPLSCPLISASLVTRLFRRNGRTGGMLHLAIVQLSTLSVNWLRGVWEGGVSVSVSVRSQGGGDGVEGGGGCSHSPFLSRFQSSEQ